MDIRGIKIDTRTYDFDAKITEVEADLTNSKAELNIKIQKVLDDLSAVKDSLQSGETYNINITGNAATATNADNATKDSAGNTITTTYATKAEVPTKTSQLTNDSDYITSSGSITGNAATADKATKDSAGNTITTTYATKASLAKVATTGSYNDLSNKPTIPTNTNQLTNGAGYITSSESITGNAATATTAAKLGRNGSTGTPMTFNWSGQGGQPSWLWGGNDGSNMYVYNPSNFSVNTATTATTAYKIRTSAPSSPENGDIWIG